MIAIKSSAFEDDVRYWCSVKEKCEDIPPEITHHTLHLTLTPTQGRLMLMVMVLQSPVPSTIDPVTNMQTQSVPVEKTSQKSLTYYSQLQSVEARPPPPEPKTLPNLTMNAASGSAP